MKGLLFQYNLRISVAEERMRKSSLIVVISVLAATMLAGLVVFPENVRASTLYVGGTGAGNYTFIQDAIDDAYPGDTVFVFSGVYLERILINKTISLVGEDGNVTIYGTGGMTHTVVNVSADWVNITGFTLQDPADEVTFGLMLNSSKFVSIRDCNISGNTIGVYLRHSDNNTLSAITSINRDTSFRLRFSHNNTISNAKLASRNVGIYLHQSSNNTLTNLSVGHSSFPTRMGVDLYYSPDNIIANSEFLMNLSVGITGILMFESPRTDIENNRITDSFNGIGFLGQSSRNCTVVNNTISGGINLGISASNDNAILNNTVSGYFYGIYNANRDLIAGNTLHSNYFGMGIANNNTVAGNTIHGNDEGILLFGDNNTLVNNSIFLNAYGIHVDSGEGNRIYHNSFVTNFVQALDEGGTNQWDNGYPSGGNYWSDYAGVDLKWGPDQNLTGSDGIGDTPYEIDFGTRDRYPLMSPTVSPPPRAPTALRASLSGLNSENVTLNWSLSPDDGGGFRNVVGYDIYRGSTLDPEGSGYALIASVPNGTMAFIDAFAGEGDPSDYFYLVRAIDVNGSGACALNQAGKFTRVLAQGPNLISIPLIQLDRSIEGVLQTVSHDKAWFYDSVSQEWKSYMKSKDYRGALRDIHEAMGVWVDVTRESNLTVAGVVPHETTIHLNQGWNLVGFPSFNTTYTVADLKAETGAVRVEGFDPLNPPYFLKVLADGDVLQAGQGYWVKASAATTWTVSGF